MANLTEESEWEPGIYQYEATDPLQSGPGEIDNLQGQQLANRTKYLKDALEAMESDVQGLGPDGQNMVDAAIMQALDLAGLANREIAKTLVQRIQTGEITVYNRGVISGCTVTKSQSATRNLSLAAGSIFMHGRIFPVAAMDNSAAVPANPGGASAVCYSYLWIGDGGVVHHDCTALGDVVPTTGLVLYSITVPAGNNEQNDPHLGNCTLTDLRRVEAGYPGMFVTAPFAYVALPFNLLAEDYAVDLDIESFEGSGFQMGYIYVSDRLSNGFKVCCNGTVDAVLVRWTARKQKL